MEYTITITGIVLCLSGILLAWHKKGTGVFLTFIFGFSLIIITSPLGERLRSLSISKTGISIDIETGEVISESPSVLLNTVQAESSPTGTDRVDATEKESTEIDRNKAKHFSVKADITTDRENLNWSQISVELNKSSIEAQGVYAALTKAGIVIDRIYGISEPERFVLAFGPNVPVANIQTLLHALENIEIEAVRYSSDQTHEHRVFIGSYGRPSAVLTAQMRKRLLDKSITTSDLISLVTTKMKD